MNKISFALLAAYTSATDISVNVDMEEISMWFDGKMAEYNAGQMNSQ